MASPAADQNSSPQLFLVAKDLVSLQAFHAILWVLVSICTVLCAGRLYVRYVCFHRLLVDDVLMLFAWSTLAVIATLAQIYIGNVYMLNAVSKGEELPTPTFLPDVQHSLRAFGSSVLVFYLGIWAIKMNFLLFFKRIANPVRAFAVFWWVVVGFTILSGVASMALVQYKCLFGDILYIIAECGQYSAVKQTYDFFKVSCIVDVVSNALIIVFPIVVLWRVRIGWRRKLILAGIFSLVSFTIAVTIVRGAIIGGTYKSIDKNKPMQLSVTWIWFWLFIEHSVALIIACLVSFRALFVLRKRKISSSNEQLQAQTARNQTDSYPRKSFGWPQRVRQVHANFLGSLQAAEVIDDEILPVPASGRFSTAFITEIEARHAPTTAQNMRCKYWN